MRKKSIPIFIILLILPLTIISFSTVITGTPNSPAYFFKETNARTSPLIINHDCTDLSMIPAEWLTAAKALKWHYAHTSHGEQLTTGLERLEISNSTFSVAIGYCSLPIEAGALCILDGQPGYNDNSDEDYITPDLYWEGSYGIQRTQDTLDNNDVNISAWSWCCQLDWYSEQETQDYLDAMASLEAANPDVTFVYMTGNAQTENHEGYNRYARNMKIRQYCITHNKVLFDFADLDCWYNGEQHTYAYGNLSIPSEHPHYHGDQAGHTTYSSCENKGKAVWWLMACLAGWNAPETTYTYPSTIPSVSPETYPFPISGLIILGSIGLIAILIFRKKTKR